MKEAAEKFGVKPKEIDFVHNGGKDVKKNFSRRN